jgi:predicted MFS family arabinose efflux permease
VLVVDRYDRRHALLFVYAGFAVATALCGIAPGYESLLGARLLAGAFGGVAGALILAIVADVVPYERRARANALVASAFSLAAIAGVPAGLWLAALSSWRTPFSGCRRDLGRRRRGRVAADPADRLARRARPLASARSRACARS